MVLLAVKPFIGTILKGVVHFQPIHLATKALTKKVEAFVALRAAKGFKFLF